MLSNAIVISSEFTNDIIPSYVDNNKVQLLVIASVKTLKRKNKNYGKELMRDSIDSTLTRETYDELWNKLIHSKWIKLNIIGNWECLFLPNDTKVYKQSNIQGIFAIENYFWNLKSNIIDELFCPKSLFLKKLIHGKMIYFIHIPSIHLTMMMIEGKGWLRPLWRHRDSTSLNVFFRVGDFIVSDVIAV